MVKVVGNINIQNKVKALLKILNNGLYEKERSIRLNFLAVLAGESSFMLGEPGTAKSLVARRVSEAFEEPSSKGEIKFFDYLMNQFSLPDEVFGPVSIQELKNDNYIRKTDHYLPKAQFAFLDEIWKANPAIQNALLTILNERIFRNGGNVEKVPLIGFMSASNELPEKDSGLEAIFDRFLVRLLELPISDEDNFREMISSERKLNIGLENKDKLTVNDIKEIQSESEKVELSDECYNVIKAIRKLIEEKNNESNREPNERYTISDRRWKKIVNLMRVSAWCNGRSETDLMDASLIADCIWSTVNQEKESKDIVKEAIENFGMECVVDYGECEKGVRELITDIDNNFFEKDVYVTIKQTDRQTNDTREYYIIEDNDGHEYLISIRCYSFARNYFHYFMRYGKEEKYETVPVAKVNIDLINAIVKVDGIRFRLVRASKSMAEKTRKATVAYFDDTIKTQKDAIKEQIYSIEAQIGGLDTQFKNNLFADCDSYYGIIFEEQINMKTKFDKLLKEIDIQQARYKALL